MTTPITIESFDVEGFRAYLKPQSFPLRKDNKPASLAVFAPNAKGKSSLVDAFEYYFSEDATLQRLGQRASQTQAGPTALEHVKAVAEGVTPRVGFKFRQGSCTFENARPIANGKNIPDGALRVLSAIKVPFVIRGYELRSFVDASAEGRYQEMSSWFSLDPLLSIQRNLRPLLRRVKSKADSQAEINERHLDVNRITADVVSKWDEPRICEWFNTQFLAKLDTSLSIAEISETDSGYLVLAKRKEDEEKLVGVASLKMLIAQIEALSISVTANDEHQPSLVVSFERSVSELDGAVIKETAERNKASESVFYEVWNKAHSLFEMEDHDFGSCPVCDTEFQSTPYGSRDGVRLSINTKLATLTAYRTAENALRKAKQGVSDNNKSLKSASEILRTGLVDADYEAHANPVADYLAALNLWSTGMPSPSSADLLQALGSTLKLLVDARDRLVNQQGENTYARAHNIAGELIQVKSHLDRINRTKAEFQKLYTELTNQATTIEKAIVEHTQGLISNLESDVDALYKKLQGAGKEEPPLIRFQLAGDNVSNQQQVRLVIDFADNRIGVSPSGYLSDSQIHTVALALRLVAIRTFNTGAPFIVLDDVVTSYDADHRKTIASTLAEEFEGFQIVLVTLDEQFFNLLRDHLPAAKWTFSRIIHIDPAVGPVFTNHQTSDNLIQRKLDDESSAGEEIRKAEEEWLLTICRDFGAEVVIRAIERPYIYDRGELAIALAKFLNSKSLVPPKVPGISNSFLNSLQQGYVENFASHFSDNPYMSYSSGDEKTRWKEFQYFRDLFVCPSCNGKRFKRPKELSKPVCNKCEIQFEFKKA